MNVTYHTEPWVHEHITDFLDAESFKQLQEFCLGEPLQQPDHKEPLRKVARYTKLLIDRSEILKKCLSNFTLILKEKNLYSRYDERNVLFELAASYPGYYYRLHEDSATKVYSFILYVHGEGEGTELYSKDKTTLVKTVDWELNTGMGFKREEHTWHNLGARNVSVPRYTLNMILLTHAL